MSIVTKESSLHEFLSPTEELLEEARRGRMFILVDDEDRENEGDLVIPAQFATPDAINFMARFARGLICLAMTRSRVEQLGLPLMAQANGTRHQTAFTVSIEAREGVTTGISAADRARTIAVAINPETKREDIVTPGHVFPLVAREGGTLVRAGHTEAAVDFARMAGLNPAGVICEIMNEDGTMARLPDLVSFAQHHGLKLGTIADLIAHRRRTERLVKRVEEGRMPDSHGQGEWRLIVYANTLEYGEHVALVKGDLSRPGPVLVRMHAVNVLHDIVGMKGPHDLQRSMAEISAAGRGAVVIIRDIKPTSISERVRAGRDRTAPPELRDYGIGAQILADLGVKEMILLSNHPKAIVGLEGYGLAVVETRPIDGGGETEEGAA
ncbi:3,4-dihydroxy-2-butanone-4-phosphate synthase [Pseudoroseomonas ludipueritiae]|uniref:3,4-dihydroxy-2-butanone 4-phosphate synthase n=1 Tax=Pseudoroseomonas ludipueritiae TaxID=198093 RepID=A0ABR7R1A9_9PROT|nr:3,4-dihydroxy-2-butanone-4-phosphate synthase [Pseudoroseomonas ludipueritiae]MBC9175520.1 3,4-dihydroxy-2-butanone-4-phosphate synthase [Pseudoroseomonas ludipueritiae]MCG7361344.1 3,4-dihydroxy-2-butanone-4-phosphate synthase [Roseomonas sp. ACRSG]